MTMLDATAASLGANAPRFRAPEDQSATRLTAMYATFQYVKEDEFVTRTA